MTTNMNAPFSQPPRQFNDEVDKAAWHSVANGWPCGLSVRDPDTGRTVRVESVDHGYRQVGIRVSGGRLQHMMPAELLERYGDQLREAADAAEEAELEEMRAAGMIAGSDRDDANSAGSVENHLRQDMKRLADVADANPSDENAQQAAHDALMRMNIYLNADLHGNDRGLVLRDLLDHYTDYTAFGDGTTQDRVQPVILALRAELWDLEKGVPRDLEPRRNDLDAWAGDGPEADPTDADRERDFGYELARQADEERSARSRQDGVCLHSGDDDAGIAPPTSDAELQRRIDRARADHKRHPVEPGQRQDADYPEISGRGGDQ